MAEKGTQDVWKWIAGILASIILSAIVTYAATTKEYVLKNDFTELRALVLKNSENLNQLIGMMKQQMESK